MLLLNSVCSVKTRLVIIVYKSFKEKPLINNFTFIMVTFHHISTLVGLRLAECCFYVGEQHTYQSQEWETNFLCYYLKGSLWNQKSCVQEIFHVSHVIWPMSHVTCHVSCVTRCVSPVTCPQRFQGQLRRLSSFPIVSRLSHFLETSWPWTLFLDLLGLVFSRPTEYLFSRNPSVIQA